MADTSKKEEEEALAAELLQEIASKDDGSEDKDDEDEAPPEGEGPEPDEAPEDPEEGEGEPMPISAPPQAARKGVGTLSDESTTAAAGTDLTFAELAEGLTTIVQTVVSKALADFTPTVIKAVGESIDTKVSEALTKALAAPIGEGENAQSISKALVVLLGRTSTLKKGVSDLNDKVDAGNSVNDALAKGLSSVPGMTEAADKITKALQDKVRTTPAVSEGAKTGEVIDKGTVQAPNLTGGSAVDESGLTEADKARIGTLVQKALAVQETTNQAVPGFGDFRIAAQSGKLSKALIDRFEMNIDKISK